MLVHVIDINNRHHYRNARHTLAHLRRKALFEALLQSAVEGHSDGIALPEICPEIEALAIDLVVLDPQHCFIAGLRMAPICRPGRGLEARRPPYFGGVATLLSHDETVDLRATDWEVGTIVFAPDTSDVTRHRAGTLLAMAALQQSVRLNIRRFIGICDPACLLRLKRVGWHLKPLSLENCVGEQDLFAFSCACGEEVFNSAITLTQKSGPFAFHLPDLGREGQPLQIEGIGPLVELLTLANAQDGQPISRSALAILNKLIDEA